MKMLCHDPRISNDRSHKVETGNTALIAAEMACQAFPECRFGMAWDNVAASADYCDEPVTEALMRERRG